jgi:glycogen debranching enzyme
MNATLKLKENFPVLASSSRALEHVRVLKHGDMFAVFDRSGDVLPGGEQGIYYGGTRFLSHLVVLVDDRRPLLLSSTVKEDNALMVVDLTNPDYLSENRIVRPRDTVHVFRCSFLWNGICYNKLRVHNYDLRPLEVSLELFFGGDFADIFEVRGVKRERRGTLLEPEVEPDSVCLAYEGLDRCVRRTRICFDPAPRRLSGCDALFSETIPPHGECTYLIAFACEIDERKPSVQVFETALGEASEDLRSGVARDATIYTSNEQFNDWVNRSTSDLHMMATQTLAGPYPYAGVPWFSTEFGRDGIITALEHLWVNPAMARGVLGYLAATQARETTPEQDAEPGKILHEVRRGEMASLREIPFGRYYGSVDATALFVMLAGAYYERTADRELIESIWPNLEAALGWIAERGDLDGDGFVEYARSSPKGLVHQGWKDSVDPVFHADGTLATAPVALCEVQGYCFAAWRAAAALAVMLGLEERAAEYRHRADALQRSFEQAFWSEDLKTYALALDGKKQPCRVRTSNPGHCLFAGIAGAQHAQQVAHTLLDDSHFSGWGIRTVADTEPRYNPMSYHNGSVWPHDNAIAAYGLARYGFKHGVLKVFTGLFDISLFVDLHRMPELICGFVRRAGEGPTLYPVACAPQAWSAASVFLLLQACLGLEIDAPRMQIRFTRPVLPESLEHISLRNLRIRDSSVDLSIDRHGWDVGINLARRDGDVEILVLK